MNEGGMSAGMSNLGTAQMKNYNISMKRLAAWEMVLLSKARLMERRSSFSFRGMIFSSWASSSFLMYCFETQMMPIFFFANSISRSREASSNFGRSSTLCLRRVASRNFLEWLDFSSKRVRYFVRSESFVIFVQSKSLLHTK